MRAPLPPDLLQDLRDRIRGIEGVRDHGPPAAGVPTGFPALDRLLADGGLRKGTLVEWRGDTDGGGAATLALAVSAHVLRSDGTLVVIDAARDFYPVGAAQLGVPLDRTVVVRPDDARGALWAWEEALRAPGVGVTFGWLGATTDRVVRRLQLAVETGGGLGFLVRPPGTPAGAASAATRLTVEPLPTPGTSLGLGRRLRVRVTRGQADVGQAVAEVALGDEPGPLPLVPELAGPVAAGRRAGRPAAGAGRPHGPGPGEGASGGLLPGGPAARGGPGDAGGGRGGPVAGGRGGEVRTA